MDTKDIEEQYDEAVLRLDELIAYLGSKNSFDPKYEARLLPYEWQEMQYMAVADPAVNQRVSLLRGIPQSQVVLPDK